MTYTYARLPMSQAAYDEISEKLKLAGYHHCFHNNGDIDMHGIGVCVEEADRYAALMGSDWQPSIVTINENLEVQLGDLVRFAFERSGMTLKQWNKLPCRVREVLLLEAVIAMRETTFDG